MKPTNSKVLFAAGQSIWYDNINRSLIKDGSLAKMIAEGVIYGITTNPSIFAKAIPNAVYDDAIAKYAAVNLPTRRIFDMLTVEDVQAAADMFIELYNNTSYTDGYVSLEVSPELARDAEGTVRDVIRLAALVNRPNVMFKIPGTEECVPAIRELTGRGYCINVTLLFDVDQYRPIADAYLCGVEKFIKSGGDARRLTSVASVFVSRIDTLVDSMLDKLGTDEAAKLRGQAAIAVMTDVNAEFVRFYASERFAELKAKGATRQRVLWASTSVKDPAHKPTKYVDCLVAPNTVNTVPPATLDEYLKTGETKLSLCPFGTGAEVISKLAALGIDIPAVCHKLQEDGIVAFQKAFEEVLAVLDSKCSQFGR